MKKLVLAVAIVSLVVSCKKVPAGGNHGVLKKDAAVERYSDDEQGTESTTSANATTEKSAVKVEVNGTEISANKGGLEESMVAFLKADGYKKATDDAALKDKWYNFDSVTFKTGSANQLEKGKEQLSNLATILKAYPDAKIKIGGYTDKTGDEAVNKKISTQRAEFIKAELTKLGVGSQVVSAEGYGSEFATVAADKSDAERAIDRKMSVRFTK
jgi:outer membrane protein OmpA-like peptidoglycan-associated protein